MKAMVMKVAAVAAKTSSGGVAGNIGNGDEKHVFKEY